MSDKLKEIAKQLGSAGGKKTKETYGTDFYKRISRLGVEARKKKAKQPSDKLSPVVGIDTTKR